MKGGADPAEGVEPTEPFLPHSLTRRSVVFGLSAAWCIFQGLAQARADAEIVLAIGGGTPLGPGDGPGFASSIAIEAFRRIGIRADVIALPAKRALINANAGIEDGDALRHRVIEEHYPNLVRVPEPILQFELSAFTYDPDLATPSANDLQDRAIGFETGLKLLEVVFADHPRRTGVANLKQLFTLLANGRIDVALAERWQGNWWVRRLELDCRVLPTGLAQEPMFIYLHKRHAGLVSRLADALRAMKADGTHGRLFLKILAPLEHVRP